jgi:membrane fusion protein, heavy metal efflux system
MLPRLASLLGLLLLAACDHGHDRPHPEGPAKEEEKTAQVTVWGERFEIFLEHKLVVADAPTSFVTHVTDQKTLEPRRKDKVVFVLRQGAAAPIEHVEREPKRAGIYIPELTFPKAGDWSVTLRIPVDGAESVVELPAFTVYATKEDAKKAPEPAAPEGLSFLKEQQWRVLSKTEPVGKRKLVERVRVPAVVAARPGSRAAVVPPLAGRLIAPSGKTLPSLGDRVEAGQVLALVQPPFSEHAARLVEARAEAARAQLALDQAEIVLARAKKLAGIGARTERELQEADFAVRSARASQEAALALKDAYERSGAVTLQGGSPALELRSPIAGVVVSIQAALGEHVATEKPVFVVLDASKVHLEARIPEADLPRLAGGKAALADLPGTRGSFLSLEGKARQVFLGPEVDPATRTVPLLFEVENPHGDLRIGSALTLYLETARTEDAIAVPASAVVDEEARPIAFVQLSGETFEKRYLKLGLKEGSWIQVLDGLADGERVVSKEAMAVRLASMSGVIPAHGHAH